MKSDTPGPALTAGRLARLAGVNLETIRYYERRGLLPEPERTPCGYRTYGSGDARRIRFVKRAQDLGFSLDEIKGLLDLRISPGATCRAVRRRAEAKIDDIEKKLRALGRMRTVLKRLAAACGGRGRVEACPILAALEEEGKNP